MSQAKCHVGCSDYCTCRKHDLYAELTELLVHTGQLRENTDWNILFRIQYFLKENQKNEY